MNDSAGRNSPVPAWGQEDDTHTGPKRLFTRCSLWVLFYLFSLVSSFRLSFLVYVFTVFCTFVSWQRLSRSSLFCPVVLMTVSEEAGSVATSPFPLAVASPCAFKAAERNAGISFETRRYGRGDEARVVALSCRIPSAWTQQTSQRRPWCIFSLALLSDEETKRHRISQPELVRGCLQHSF